jgi:hypothetical protein
MHDTSQTNRRQRRITTRGWILLAVLLAAALELLAYTGLLVGKRTVLSVLIYTPPVPPPREEYADYLAGRNPVTGWPSNQYETPDDIYIRPVEGFSDNDAPCISAYGDSFIYGSEVSNEETWSNFLGAQLGCRPANYGVPGFGLGQALLRYKENTKDAAPVSFLGIYPFDYARTINQYRPFIGGGINGWKPRFYMEDGELALAPLPEIAYEELANFYAQPKDYLPHESFLPGSELGPVHFKFPYTPKVVRLLFKEDILNGIRGAPRWSDLIQPGHHSQTFETVAAIASEYMEVCRTRQKQCFIALLPTNTAYNYFIANGDRVSQSLLDEFARRNIPILDLTPRFQEALGTAPFCSILKRPSICEGHFSAKGNQLFADFLNEYVQENNLLQ